MNATYHTIPEVAEYYHVKESTVQRWVRKGRLRVVNLGGNRQGPYLVSEDDMRAFESRNAMGPESVALAPAGGTTVLQYKGNEVRMVEKEDGPWWVLADVCKVLSLTNPSKVASRLDDDEKQQMDFNPNSELGLGHNGATIINEPGLYSVILRSDKPEAKEFKRWVTHEVLPAIRRTGQYVSAQMASPQVKVPVIPDAGRPTAELVTKEILPEDRLDVIRREASAIRALADLYEEYSSEESLYPLRNSIWTLAMDISIETCRLGKIG